MIKTLKEIYKYRELLFSLVRKSLKARYKGSFLGFLWTFINPLMQLLIYAFVFQVVFRIQIPNYTMLLFIALLPWANFSSTLNSGMTSVVDNSSLVKKVYFPRIILPISISLTYTIDFIYCVPILIAAMFITHLPFNRWILFFPLVLVLQFLYQTGISFAISAINVRFRDTKQIVGLITMAWFYFTPILFKLDMLPETASILGMEVYPRILLTIINPMTGIIDGYRAAFFYGAPPDPASILISAAEAIIAFVVGMAIFRKMEKTFAEDL